jgi:hypothetical protein
MKESIVERENRIAEFKKGFFANVKIESRSKGVYFIINRANYKYERISAEELLNQNKIRAKMLGLNDKMIPDMRKSEYLGFVQNVIDNTSIL